MRIYKLLPPPHRDNIVIRNNIVLSGIRIDKINSISNNGLFSVSELIFEKSAAVMNLSRDRAEILQ